MILKVYNLLREFVNPGQVDTAGNYLPYGEYDAFPNKISKLVDESPVGSSCISTLCDFIEGEGFSEEDLGKFVVNQRGETFAHIHNETSKSLGKFQGFAWHFTFNTFGQVVNWYSLPFENCRLGKPDSFGWVSQIHYNPYFGTDQYKRDKTICYDVFNSDPKVVMAQQARDGIDKKTQKPLYKGQIYYFGTTKPLNRFYPVPEYWSAKYWLEVDRRISEYHQKNLANGFLQPVMMTIIGDPNQPSTDPAYAGLDAASVPTAGQVVDQYISENFMGTERIGNLWLNWVSKVEEKAILEAFPANNQEGYMNSLIAAVKDMISTATKVPAILANIVTGASLGGDGNAIRAAVKLLQQRVVKWHHLLEREYMNVFKAFYQPVTNEVKIIHYNPFPEMATVDAQVWAALTPEEKRKWIQDNTEIEIIATAPVSVEPPPGENVPRGTNAKFENILYNNYPQKVKDNAQKAFDWQMQTERKCGTKIGLIMNEKLRNGGPVSFKELKRLYNFLKRNEQFKNSQFIDSCDVVNYYAWGGSDMYQWAEEKINEIMT